MKKIDRYRRVFSESRFWAKLKHFATAAGLKTVYTALLLYYAYRRKETPAWAKRLVLGVLGYFIMPIDMIPDLGFLIGYTDDLGVLSFALVTIAGFVNADVRANARERLTTWFPAADETILSEVDKKL
ncbi:YkvA family protein [Neolewinella lacunae]|uniref:DUF1232 domain-containing protein n=1 Tax=Neolewinella lacunae TaxID=1517758 RepID=A0A923TD94_9BACT|nr:YkvA family protein [Neolewinella lacunae]MBC6994587.1 DUF1232 domain-containing protein [Neolewinella lacunae]MDN3634459.1 YkvA family protein [Neolewinella lacunae]